MLGAAFIAYVGAVSLSLGFSMLEAVGHWRRAPVLAGAAETGRRIFTPLAAAAGLALVAAVVTSPAQRQFMPWGLTALVLGGILPLAGRRRPGGYWTVAVASLLALAVVDRAAEGALLAKAYPLPFAAPNYPVSSWGAAAWFWLHQVLAGGGAAGFLAGAAGALSRDPARGRALGVTGVAAGLWFLLPQPMVGYYYCEQLLFHYTSAWGMLMGGGVRHLWYYTSWLVVAFFAAALAGVAATRLLPWHGGRGGRLWMAAGLVLATAGLVWSLIYGGSIMVPEFTWEMGQAAAVGFVAGGLLAVVSVRGLFLGLGILSMTVLVLMGIAWAQADALLAYKNHLAVRPTFPVAVTRKAQIARGEELARFAGCFTCHGAAGSAYRPNPGDPTQLVPAWNSPEFAATFGGPNGRKKLWTVLWEGQYAYRMRYYPAGNDWSVRFNTIDNYYNVPAWNGILSRREMGYLITYIRSRIPKKG
ncbi:MAG: c-type cytochrome [Thermaerobacter sp.]|nr:c-type cytochrome [Thermaerobacter sp.]